MSEYFNREYLIMKNYYTSRAKKNKKLKGTAAKYQVTLNEKNRDLLLDEYFINICRLYFKRLFKLFMIITYKYGRECTIDDLNLMGEDYSEE